ncbi:MAG: hypothetical protein UHE93_07855 [Muribaculaceae bacterium]|nr:hypothetical protein [Muribaculaceae bacterium]
MAVGYFGCILSKRQTLAEAICLRCLLVERQQQHLGLKATDTRRGNMPQMLTRRATRAAFRAQSDRSDLTTNINNQRSQAHAPDSSSYMHKYPDTQCIIS